MKSWIKAALAGIALAVSFALDSSIHRLMPYLHNPLLDGFFHWISLSLFTVIMLMLLSSLALWEGRKRQWILPLWLSAGAALMAAEVLKLLFVRERPDSIVMTFLWMKDFSFPSAHAATCFALVPILDREFPRLSVFWIAFAVLVAVSRLYLGVHYLSDVIAGAALGYLIGVGIIYAAGQVKHGKARA